MERLGCCTMVQEHCSCNYSTNLEQVHDSQSLVDGTGEGGKTKSFLRSRKVSSCLSDSLFQRGVVSTFPPFAVHPECVSPARVSRILLCSALPFQTLIVHTAKEGRNPLQSFCGEICRSSPRSAATCRTIHSVLSYPVSMEPVISAGAFPPHPHASRLLFFSLHHPPCLPRFSMCFRCVRARLPLTTTSHRTRCRPSGPIFLSRFGVRLCSFLAHRALG